MPRRCADFCVIREQLSLAGVQRNPRTPLLFKLELMGLVFVPVSLSPPHNDILVAVKTEVCSLVNTFILWKIEMDARTSAWLHGTGESKSPFWRLLGSERSPATEED